VPVAELKAVREKVLKATNLLIDEAFSLLHEGLVKETIEQLVEPLSERRKKLFAEK
jgi:hypothetical protein